MNKRRRSKSTGIGLALGISMGVAIGVAMDNVGAGIAIGVAIGAALGSSGAFGRNGKDSQDAGGGGTESYDPESRGTKEN